MPRNSRTTGCTTIHTTNTPVHTQTISSSSAYYSKCEKRVPLRLDNVYGVRRHPVQLYKDAEKFSCWKETVNEQLLVPVISEPSSSEPPNKVPDIAKLCQEGGVSLVHYLLAKEIGSHNNLTKPPCKWSYCDISKLLPDEHKQWEDAFHKKLDML